MSALAVLPVRRPHNAQRSARRALRLHSAFRTLAVLKMPSAVPGSALNAYNNEPGSGRTGFFEIPPNNYDWYSEDEKYKPNVQADGGILSSAHARHRFA